MATFRNSAMPEWALNENNGYFKSRARQSIRPQGNGQPVQSSGWPQPTCLPKTPELAVNSIKKTRLMWSMLDAFIWQLGAIVIFYFISPVDRGEKKYYNSIIIRLFDTFFGSILCMRGIIFMLVLDLTLLMFSHLLTKPDGFNPSIQHRIQHCTSLRFLLKPFLLVVFVFAKCGFYFQKFDPKFAEIYHCKPLFLDDDFGSKEVKCNYFEDNLVLRIAVSIAALHFFVKHYINEKFTLQFPSVPVHKSWHGSLFNVYLIVNAVRPALLISVITGVGCAVFGPVTYSPILRIFGLENEEDRFLERIFMFLSIWFLFRLFFYTFLTLSILPLLLIVVNFRFTELVNFPVEQPANKQEPCLLLYEAMKGDKYLRMLAFHEYNYKADCGTFDVKVFFNITHPGNHPYNWRNIVTACYEMIKETNEGLVNYLKTNHWPIRYSDLGLGPTILNRLRENESASNPGNALQEPIEPARNMRDLTSSTRPDFSNQIPTIVEAIWQNLELMWNDARAGIQALFSMQTVSNLLFGGKLSATIPENVIANLLSNFLPTYWAISGTMKLVCVSLEVDRRGVVNQDIKAFCARLLELNETLSALDIYMNRFIDDQFSVNRKVFTRNKEMIAKLSNICVFSLAQLHDKFSTSYNMLDMDESMQRRILEIVSNP